MLKVNRLKRLEIIKQNTERLISLNKAKKENLKANMLKYTYTKDYNL